MINYLVTFFFNFFRDWGSEQVWFDSSPSDSSVSSIFGSDWRFAEMSHRQLPRHHPHHQSRGNCDYQSFGYIYFCACQLPAHVITKQSKDHTASYADLCTLHKKIFHVFPIPNGLPSLSYTCSSRHAVPWGGLRGYFPWAYSCLLIRG